MMIKTAPPSVQTAIAPLPLNEQSRKQALMRILSHTESLRMISGDTTVEVSIDKNYRYRVVFCGSELGSRKKVRTVTHYVTRKHTAESLARYIGQIDRIRPIPVPLCPYCNRPTTLKQMPTADGRNDRFRYECVACRAWVWCHQDTAIPLGVPAKRELREKRHEAHRIISEITEEEHIDTGAVYAYLASSMKQSKKETHMGHMNENECAQAIRILSEWRDQLRKRRSQAV